MSKINYFQFLATLSIPSTLSLSVLLLAGCQTVQQTAPAVALSDDMAITDKGVLAFRDVCLASAPSYDKAWVLARKYGVKPDLDLGEEKSGMAADNSLSIQIQRGKECATTTPSRPDTAALQQFFVVIGNATGMPAQTAASSGGPSATYRGKTFQFLANRKGGEAYVMRNRD